MPLANTAPLVVGIADAGDDTDASRSDHVHPIPFSPLPTFVNVGEEFRAPETHNQNVNPGESALFALRFTNANTVNISVKLHAAPSGTGALRGSLFASDGEDNYWGKTLIQERTIADVNGLTGRQLLGSYAVEPWVPYWFGLFNDSDAGVNFVANIWIPVPTRHAQAIIGHAQRQTTAAPAGTDLSGAVSGPCHNNCPTLYVKPV